MNIHFTDADLARTRLKLEVDPLWEIVNSVQALQHSQGGLYLDDWRRSVRALAARDRKLPTALLALIDVAPEASYFPDFLTPNEYADGGHVESGIDTVLTTPRRRLRREIGLLRKPTPWLDDLARGRPAAVGDLGTALRTYYRKAVRPYLPQIEAALHIERAGRANIYLRTGVEALLTSLTSIARWHRPVLSFEYPKDRDLHLDGRGLILVPSYFCVRHPVSLADPDLPPVIVYPIAPASRLLSAPRHPGDHLSALLGTTRATILRTTVQPATTTDLARHAGISQATASHHTTVLRNAGLITTHRHRTFAKHLITPLGLRLIARE
jgi:DNA-binding transcriptional ArsR family regulator